MKGTFLKGVETSYVVLFFFGFCAEFSEEVKQDRVVNLLNRIIRQDLQAIPYLVTLIQTGNISSDNKSLIVLIFNLIELHKGICYYLQRLYLLIALIIKVLPEEQIELSLLREFLCQRIEYLYSLLDLIVIEAC